MALGPQFQKVYRGLAGVDFADVGRREVGPHWTTDPNVAFNFATSRDIEGYTPEEGEMRGTVLEASVHRRHIVDLDSKEGEGWRDMMNVQGPDSMEQELTVRPGAILHVQRAHDVDDDAGTTITHSVKSRGWRA